MQATQATVAIAKPRITASVDNAISTAASLPKDECSLKESLNTLLKDPELKDDLEYEGVTSTTSLEEAMKNPDVKELIETQELVELKNRNLQQCNCSKCGTGKGITGFK